MLRRQIRVGSGRAKSAAAVVSRDNFKFTMEQKLQMIEQMQALQLELNDRHRPVTAQHNAPLNSSDRRIDNKSFAPGRLPTPGGPRARPRPHSVAGTVGRQVPSAVATMHTDTDSSGMFAGAMSPWSVPDGIHSPLPALSRRPS